MTLHDFTLGQLARLYGHLYDRLGTEGMQYGADWRTLYHTNRGLYNSLKAVHGECLLRHRKNSELQS